MYCFEALRCTKDDCPVKHRKVRRCWNHFVETLGREPNKDECPFAPCSSCHYKLGWDIGLVGDSLFAEDEEEDFKLVSRDFLSNETDIEGSSEPLVASSGLDEPESDSSEDRLEGEEAPKQLPPEPGKRFCWEVVDCPNPRCVVRERRIIRCFKFFEPKGYEEKKRISCCNRKCGECLYKNGWDLGIITEDLFKDVIEERKLKSDRAERAKKRSLVEIYLSELEKKPLSRKDEMELAKKIAGDKYASEIFLLANLKLVVKLASNYSNRGTSLMDLIQEGNIGLIKAISKFDYTLGYRFSTYAAYWIRYYMQKAVSQQGRTIRIPHHLLAVANRIKIHVSSFQGLHQRAPTLDELSKALGLEQDKIVEVIRITESPISIEARITDDPEDESSLEFYLSDKTALSPEEAALEKSKSETCEKAISELPEKLSVVVRMHFGFGCEPQSLAEIGRQKNLSRERVRQLLSEALSRLEKLEFSADLQDYL